MNQIPEGFLSELHRWIIIHKVRINISYDAEEMEFIVSINRFTKPKLIRRNKELAIALDSAMSRWENYESKW